MLLRRDLGSRRPTERVHDAGAGHDAGGCLPGPSNPPRVAQRFGQFFLTAGSTRWAEKQLCGLAVGSPVDVYYNL